MRGLRVARLRLRRHRADLDEAETHRAQAVDAFAVLVQPGGQADAIGETQAGHGDRVVHARLLPQAHARACSAAGPAPPSSDRGRVPGPGRTGRGGSGRRERGPCGHCLSRPPRGCRRPPGAIIRTMTQDELKALVGRAALQHVVRGPAGRRGHRLHGQPLHRRAGDDQGPLRRRRVQLAGQHRAAAPARHPRSSRRTRSTACRSISTAPTRSTTAATSSRAAAPRSRARRSWPTWPNASSASPTRASSSTCSGATRCRWR